MRRVQSLALSGGEPEFDVPLHVGRPNQPPRGGFLRRVEAALDRNWLTNRGPLVQEFEARIADATGTTHCVAVSSGTAGLEVLFRSMGVSGKVAVPSFTFVATAAAAAWLGLEPHLLDIDRRTRGLSVEEVLGTTEELGAIVGVHVWGLPCSPSELEAAAKQLGCPIIFDAAHAFSCSFEGRPIGGFGAAEVFSFHATKVLNTIEGGAITTNDAGLAEELRRAINFGFRTYDEVVSIGTNAKMNEIAAAMGLAMLDHLPVVLDRNESNRCAYREGLADIPGVALVEPLPGSTSNHHYMIVTIDPTEYGLTRDDLYRFLHSENVLARRYFYPGVHHMDPFARYGHGRSFPETERLASSCLAVPTGLAVTSSDVAKVAGLVALAHENSCEVGKLLEGHPLP